MSQGFNFIVMLNKKLSRFILKSCGWKIGETASKDMKKCVLIAAPHTSNWDFILGLLCYRAMGMRMNFLIKKDWFKPPVGVLIKKAGGIPVDRRGKTNLTDQIVNQFHSSDYMHLIVTPEGTRKPVKNWKKGFYHIALKANVPIVIGELNYKEKVMNMENVFYPTGNYPEDIKVIRSYFSKRMARYPQKFVELEQ